MSHADLRRYIRTYDLDLDPGLCQQMIGSFAGLALLHGLGLARFWLIGLYVTLLLFMQLIYPLLVVLAVVDSLIDFRGRLARKNGAGSANGEG